jgi:hypothetical protein
MQSAGVTGDIAASALRAHPVRHRVARRALARGLAPLVLSIAVCASAADRDRESIGMDLGTQRARAMCPAGAVLVGFREVLGYWLYMIYPVCAPADAQGRWTDAFIDRAHPLQNAGGLGVHGITDFLAPDALCRTGAYVIGYEASVIPVVEGDATYAMPGALRPVCRERNDPTPWTFTQWRDWKRATQKLDWASPQPALQVPWDGPSGARTCAPGEAAVGLWGAADAWLRSVGLVCRPWSAPPAIAAARIVPPRADPSRVTRSVVPAQTPEQAATQAQAQRVTGTLRSPGQMVVAAPSICQRYPTLCDGVRAPPRVAPARP